MFPEDLPAVGATEHLIGAIKSGEWRGLVDGGNKWYDAAKRWGLDVVAEPKVRIGTIHSVKGQEADNVIVLTSQGRRIAEAEADSPEKFAEERRIEYVAATRARRKLVVAHDPRERYRMELPL
jgi:superfamily I DNA/RNA helicase